MCQALAFHAVSRCRGGLRSESWHNARVMLRAQSTTEPARSCRPVNLKPTSSRAALHPAAQSPSPCGLQSLTPDTLPRQRVISLAGPVTATSTHLSGRDFPHPGAFSCLLRHPHPAPSLRSCPSLFSTCCPNPFDGSARPSLLPLLLFPPPLAKPQAQHRSPSHGCGCCPWDNPNVMAARVTASTNEMKEAEISFIRDFDGGLDSARCRRGWTLGVDRARSSMKRRVVGRLCSMAERYRWAPDWPSRATFMWSWLQVVLVHG